MTCPAAFLTRWTVSWLRGTWHPPPALGIPHGSSLSPGRERERSPQQLRAPGVPAAGHRPVERPRGSSRHAPEQHQQEGCGRQVLAEGEGWQPEGRDHGDTQADGDGVEELREQRAPVAAPPTAVSRSVPLSAARLWCTSQAPQPGWPVPQACVSRPSAPWCPGDGPGAGLAKGDPGKMRGRLDRGQCDRCPSRKRRGHRRAQGGHGAQEKAGAWGVLEAGPLQAYPLPFSRGSCRHCLLNGGHAACGTGTGGSQDWVAGPALSGRGPGRPCPLLTRVPLSRGGARASLSQSGLRP